MNILNIGLRPWEDVPEDYVGPVTKVELHGELYRWYLGKYPGYHTLGHMRNTLTGPVYVAPGYQKSAYWTHTTSRKTYWEVIYSGIKDLGHEDLTEYVLSNMLTQ